MQEKLVFQLDSSSTGGGEHAVNNDKLISAIDSLASQMGSFSSSIKVLMNKSNNYSAAMSKFKEDQNKHESKSYAQTTSRLRAIASNQNADFRNSPEGKSIQQERANSNTVRNQALLKKQDNLSALMDKANEYEKSGDSKFAKELLRNISSDLNGAIKKSATSKLSQIVALSSIPIAGRAFDKLMGADVTAGSAIMQNPITNGFNYGSQVSGVMNADNQRKNAYVEGISALAGGGVGRFAPVTGLGIMEAGKAYASYKSAGNTLTAQAWETATNNTMSGEALGATNQRASQLSGGKEYAVTDAQYPLVIAMKKAAGSYNKNFKAIDQLTDYTIAAQLTMQQSTSMAAATGFLTKGMNASQSKDFVNNMTSKFSAYGVSDPAAAAITATTLKQTGMPANVAIDTVARSAGLNPGMQGAQAAYYGDTISGRTIKNYIAKHIYGVDLPNVMAGKGDPQASKYRKQLLQAQKEGKLYSTASAMGFEGLYNETNYQSAEAPTTVNGNIKSTKTQRGFIAATNALTAENSKGFTIGKSLESVSAEADKTSSSFFSLRYQINLVTHMFSSLKEIINNPILPQKSHTSNMPQTKSGTSGSTYGPKIKVIAGPR